jgi:hypothetical protein
MSLNGIMGIGLSSAGVPDERKEIARGGREAHVPAVPVKADNLSAVQEDYVTLQGGVGQGGVIGVLTPASSENEGAGGVGFHAIA